MMTVDTAAAVEPVGDVTAALGEGPYWVPEDDCLLWVDIEGAPAAPHLLPLRGDGHRLAWARCRPRSPPSAAASSSSAAPR